MNACYRLLCLVLLACSGFAASYDVLYTAAMPSDPAYDAATRSRLLVGKTTVTCDDSTVALLDLVGGWGFSTMRSVWKVDQFGNTIDNLGQPTVDPVKFQLDHLVVSGIYVSVPDGSGGWTSTTVFAESQGNGPTFVANTTAIAGEFYWYTGSTVNIVDIKHGTPFATPNDAISFNRRDLWIPEYGVARAQTNVANPARPDFGLVHAATRTLSAGSYRGGQFPVITTDHDGYLFNGATLLVNGSPNPDPYRLEGTVHPVSMATAFPNNTVGWSQQESGTLVQYAGRIADQRPASELDEPWRSQFISGQQVPAVILTEERLAPNRSTVDGQSTQEIADAVVAGRAGDATDQTNASQVSATLNGAEYLHTDGNGGITTSDGSFQDPTLADLRGTIAAGVMDQYVVGSQQAVNDFAQATPEVQTPPAADVSALHDSIAQVDAQLYQQTATSLPLGGSLPARFAEMNPAGYTPDYLIGELSAEGDNPATPKPDGNPFGQKKYDLDGDGDRDRMYSTDPYLNGFDQVVISWHVDDGDFRYGSYNGAYKKNTFAVYGQNHTKPEQRKLLYCGYDPIIWTSRQTPWWKGGKTYHDFALNSLLEPTGTANQYRFALRYIGSTTFQATTDPPPQPTTITKSWTRTETVTLPDNTTKDVPVEEGTETVYLYPDELSAADLANATFSVDDFVPRATDGRPTQSAKYVRTVVQRTISGSVSVAGSPVTTVVYFPAGFADVDLSPEPAPVVPNAENAWMWDYRLLGDGLPFNYQRGKNFPRGQVGVVLNDPSTLARFGGQIPLLSSTELAQAGGINMTLREVAAANPPTDDDPDIAAQLYQDWKNHRSMIHDPRDGRTDRKAGGDATANNWHGERTYDIVGGAGYYLFKGQWIAVTSQAQEQQLVRAMWDWDTYQPPTAYAVLHVDNDASKPLLNTVRAPEASTARQLLDPTSGALARDVSIAGDNLNVNARRRQTLINEQQLYFSAARGREHEIEMALYAPRSTKLHCVEWDDFNQVQRIFAGYDVTYHFDDESERKSKASFCTQVLGRPLLMSRLAGSSTANTGATDLLALAAANPGHVIFQDLDLLYGKPACFVPTVALLDDEQYGNPRPEQWAANYKVQFRHPMAVFYDDRWSAVVVAYGSNADPRKWCAKWDSYSLPSVGAGVDACQVAFEGWASDAHLTDLYDRMHASEYAQASAGNITLPDPPTVVGKPVAPIAPPEWGEGAIEFPATVQPPGEEPTATAPIWTKARSGWGSNGGTSNGSIGSLTWTNSFPDLDDLQTSHDAWLSQFSAIRRDLPGQWYENWNGSQSFVTLAGLNRTWSEGSSNITWKAHFERKPAYRNADLDIAYQNNDWNLNEVWSVPGYSQSQRVTGKVDNVYNEMFYCKVAGSNLSNRVSNGSRRDNYDLTIRYEDYGGQQHAMYVIYDGGSLQVDTNLDKYFNIYPIDDARVSAATALADADLAAYQAYKSAHVEWVNAVNAYNQYLDDLAEAQAKQQRYEAFEASRAQALEVYRNDVVSYQLALDRYNQYVAALAAWNQQKAALQPAIDRWNAYTSARSAWVFLVSGRIGEAGITWGSGEPTWDAFRFWKTQPECSCP